MGCEMAKWNKNLVTRQSVIGLLMAVTLSGCSLPFMQGQTKEEFARYVESVFKLQNGMTSQIMALGDSDTKPRNFDALLQAEQDMQKRCEALNEYANRESEGESVGLALQTRVAQSAKDCEAAAKNVQTLLRR
jgi:flagellar motor protein MotB